MAGNRKAVGVVAAEERVITDPEQLEWIDSGEMSGVPPGVRIKVLSESAERGIRNLLVSFPAGYVEPRHIHDHNHSTFLLQGHWIIEGKKVGPGGYMYGPAGVPHGPFESPEGSLVFASRTGGTGLYEFPPPPEAEEAHRDKRTVIVDPSEIEWEDVATESNLPAGIRFKAYAYDEETGRRDGLVTFPPGYVEPRHTHGSVHSDALLEGRWIIEGQEVRIGGFIYGPPNILHGPFECPDGVVACVASFGSVEDRKHVWSK
jgi:anti-sigma factor ChrR (cupin superfamily)